MNRQWIQSQNRLTRKELFTTLLRAGVDFGRIDGIPTNYLYKMCKGKKFDFRLSREMRAVSVDPPATLYLSSSHLQGEWEIGQSSAQIKGSIPLVRMMTLGL